MRHGTSLFGVPRLVGIVAALFLSAGCGPHSAPPSPVVLKLVAGGSTHVLALKSDGSVWAWGNNDSGQLGDGTTTDSHIPIAIKGLNRDVIAIAAGADFSLGLKSDGSVWAWGANDHGQLGNGGNAPSSTPGKVTGLSGRFTAIVAGRSHAMALKADGTAWAWGHNYAGQLGNGSNTDTTSAVEVSGLTKRVVFIGAGFSDSLAVEVGGSVWAWGNNGSNALGTRTPDAFQNTPVPVDGLTRGVIAVAGGSFQSVALKADGSVWSWGREFDPTGNYIGTETPTRVGGLTAVRQVQAGWGFDLALDSNGSTWVWGEAGEVLGSAAHGDALDPIEVAGLGSGTVTIGASWYNGYAIKSNGTLWAWGNNNQGQLGNGTFDPEGGSLTPVAVKSF